MLLRDTAIVLTSDHGFFLGEHHLYDKRLMYEPSIRVPLLVRVPGSREGANAGAARWYSTLTSHRRLMDLAGLPPLPAMQGKSVMPLAEERQVAWRKDWLYEYYEYPGFENVRPCRGVRTERYKYIHFFLDPQEYELYDLERDPEEKNNLYGAVGYEPLTATLRARLAALRKETDDRYEYKPSGLPLHPSRQGTGPGASTISQAAPTPHATRRTPREKLAS